jgi:flagellar motility protein MotE (MotC chaperone)
MKTIPAALLTIGLTMLAVLPAAAAESAPPAAAAATNPADAKAVDNSADNSAAYCKNIANQAADARYARQAESLAAMTKALEERIKALEDKRAEYETWVSRRKEFLDRADESVVAIYSQMRPDAAAQQIAVMEQEAAAAILSKLQPRTASAILNEMEPTTAARLTNVMAGISAVAGATKDGSS